VPIRRSQLACRRRTRTTLGNNGMTRS
jgi:hypothetical protein